MARQDLTNGDGVPPSLADRKLHIERDVRLILETPLQSSHASCYPTGTLREQVGHCPPNALAPLQRERL
ncbi:hypothetical protein ACQFX9_07690 [Aliinostoc sp. HNIBRCY26]|uniref:hypothetical protein n=1 Tax=Aliinostoc sp. HNIBRCY26 TaxID=3418997 RepID=UPI003CFD93CB